jgi:16S rRNA (cytosine967-C5)-methyltransferase
MSIMRDAHRRLAEQALEKILAARQPADAILGELYKAHRCGARDRQQIGSAVYGVLRDFRALEHHAGSRAPAALIEAWLNPRSNDDLPEDVRLNLPADLYPLLKAQYGDDLPALAHSLNTEATVDLRVNTLRATREEAQAALAEDGIESEPTPLSPIGLRLKKRLPHGARALREGLVEPQDEGSQLLALLVNPQPGEKVCDYCAGAGGKTLALGAMMRNEGELLACDVSETRLQKLLPRAQRAGLTIAEAWLLSGDQPPAASFDAVLVDAPCSATGTWRRNPELRLRPVDLPKLAAQQLRILSDAARLVKPGGRLVYATCSLLAEENDRVVDAFLSAHPAFHCVDAPLALPQQSGPRLRLLPNHHGTDGFFGTLFVCK